MFLIGGLVGDDRLRRDARPARRHYLRQLANGDCHEHRHAAVSVPGHRDVHANHARVQRVVRVPIRRVLGIHRRRQRGNVRGPGLAKSVAGAIGWASLLTPFLTFFVITSFLLGNFGTVFLVTAVTYGFATVAMLVPAIDVFDVATGRTTAQKNDWRKPDCRCPRRC